MSMILDALRKADAERRLGELPGLHTQALHGPAANHRARLWQWPSSWLVPGAVVVGLIIGLVLLAWLLKPPGTVPQPVVALPAVAPAPHASVASPPLPAADVAVPPPLPAQVVKPASETPLPTAKLKIAARPAPSATVPAAASPANLPVTSPTPSATATPLLTLATLPPNLQRELPPLVFGGSMYSDNPADRMLLIDKRLLHEGDEVAPGLVLESLMPKAAVLRYKGVRFQIGY